MKNLAIAVVLILGVFAISANLEDETKIGYVDKTYIMDRLPEYQKARVLLENFESKSSEELKATKKKMTELEGLLNIHLTEKSPEAKSLESIHKELELFERKRLDLIDIIELEKGKWWKSQSKESYQRLTRAIEMVSSKSGYTHVFDKSKTPDIKHGLIVAPAQDDLTIMVMEILELKSEDYQLGK